MTREEVLHLLESRRFVDLYAVLTEARQHHPHDLELIRSVRVLQHHLRRAVAKTA